ncbi:MIP/aquaporin family protein [Levilactobacillus tangyuanensis]|uniref:MIP/aquaporin family protein n=1 Tax=Levilactobacillus tangyuanensis TaxID=2486021 RepID=A0ABW1TRU9_9LACO|nr:aquaporin [Levilactobacillus tangyuanensis]
MQKYLAEFMGTFMLVFLGTGAVTVAAGSTLTIGLAFGLAITVSAYAFGGISGGHFNPAVTTAMLINRRIDGRDALGYVIAQVLGATVASACIKLFVGGLGLATNQLGQTDFPKISMGLAFLVEALVTFLFLLVILNVTSDRHGNGDFAGLTIGVTLAFLIIVALNLTGGSLNPARSFGPAIFAGGSALKHLWLYILAPEVGAVCAAYVGRFMGSED